MKFLILFLLALSTACSSPIEPDPAIVDAAIVVDSTPISDSAVIDAQVPLDDAAIPCSESLDLSAGTPSPDWMVTAITASTSTPSATLTSPVLLQDDVQWLAANFSGVTGPGIVSVSLMDDGDGVGVEVARIEADGDHVHMITVEPPHEPSTGPHSLVVRTSSILSGQVTVRDVVVSYTCVLSP